MKGREILVVSFMIPGGGAPIDSMYLFNSSLVSKCNICVKNGISYTHSLSIRYFEDYPIGIQFSLLKTLLHLHSMACKFGICTKFGLMFKIVANSHVTNLKDNMFLVAFGSTRVTNHRFSYKYGFCHCYSAEFSTLVVLLNLTSP